MKLTFLLYFFLNIAIAIGAESKDAHYFVKGTQPLNQICDQLIDIRPCKSRFDETEICSDLTVEDWSIFDVRFDDFPDNCNTRALPRNCAEATACTRRSGIYKIQLEKYSCTPFLVECDVKTKGGGWTLIQRRLDGSEDFYRNWLEYKQGFGDIGGEFFIGLDKLHALTNYNGPQELLIVLEDDKTVKEAKYSNFVVGNEAEAYALKHLGVYSGTAGDSLFSHLGVKFSTKDRDNDKTDGNCAVSYTGAWWYYSCHLSNLNGKYGDNSYAKGVTWATFRGHNVSMKHVTMMIRRRTF